MQIGLCVKSIFGKGGIQKNYLLWFNMFKKRKIPVTLFVLENPNINEDGIIYLKGNSLKEKKLDLLNYLKKEKFNLFLLNAEYMKDIFKKANQDYYITVHNTWEIKGFIFKRLKQKKRLLQKYKNEKLIGISKSVLDNITDNLNIPVKEKHVVYAPHNFELVYKKANEKTIDDKFFIAVGSLIKRKNYSFLIKAFYKIHNKTDYNLYIIGDGEEKNNLQKLIKKLKLESRVKLLGYKENPYPYIKQAKLLLSTSLSEGLPRVIVEALILHTPIVTTYSSKGVDEVMIEELENFVVKKYDINLFANKILDALENYPKITKKYYSKFSEENSFQKLIKLTKI